MKCMTRTEFENMFIDVVDELGIRERVSARIQEELMVLKTKLAEKFMHEHTDFNKRLSYRITQIEGVPYDLESNFGISFTRHGTRERDGIGLDRDQAIELWKSLCNFLGRDPVSSIEEVNNPDHYTEGGIESIKIIKAKLTPEEFRGFLKGNVIKYVTRANFKGSHDKDLKKTKWYQDKLVEEIDNEGSKTT